MRVQSCAIQVDHWLDLPKDSPAFKSFYKIKDVWPAESQERFRRNIAGET